MYPACIIFITLCTLGLSTASNSGGQFLQKFSRSSKTPGPINICTKNVTCVHYSPLNILAILDEELTLYNNGVSIEAYISEPKSKSYATGGILGTCRYQFQKLEFLWTDKKNGASGTTINGRGYQLEAVLYFYNARYKTFSNALNYRDGITTLTFPINIGCKPNKYFDCLAEKIKRIEEAGYSTCTTLNTIIRWFSVLDSTSSYYAYPGQYKDHITGEIYYSNTVVILQNDSRRYLSYEQFEETFLRVKNFANKHFINIQKRHPATQIVVEAKGTNLRVMDSCDDYLR